MGQSKEDLLAQAASLGINDVDENSSKSDIQARIKEEEDANAQEEQAAEDARNEIEQSDQEQADAQKSELEDDSEEEDNSDYNPVQHQVGSGGDVNLTPDRG